MKPLRILALLFGVLLTALSAASAGAQVSAYTMVALSTYGAAAPGGGSIRFGNDSASFGGGAFYNFPIHSRVTVGVDGRILYGPGSLGGATATGALRVGFVPSKVAFRPYFQLGGGVVSHVLDAGFSPDRITNPAVSFNFGLDLRITHSLDLRLFEFADAVGISNNTSVAVSYLNSGLIYHFRPSPGVSSSALPLPLTNLAQPTHPSPQIHRSKTPPPH